jgi:hypothetical protein
MDPATIAAIAMALVRYGPEVAADISDWHHKKTVPTRDEIFATYAKAKPYEAFGIPAIAPTKPV